MDSREVLRRKRAQWKLNFYSNFQGYKIMKIPEIIPSFLEKFPNFEGHWKELEVSEEEKYKDIRKCLYILPPEGYFPTHYHLFYKETLRILTPEGKIQHCTEEGISEIDYPNEMQVFKNQPHAVKNLSDFPVELEITWEVKDGDMLDLIFEIQEEQKI
jgi:hypothetical protein